MNCIIEIITNEGVYVVTGVNDVHPRLNLKGLPKIGDYALHALVFNNREEALEVVGVIKFLGRNNILKMNIINIRIV